MNELTFAIVIIVVCLVALWVLLYFVPVRVSLLQFILIR